jgi:NDP-sugar pyrophosphorylase family protein
MGTAGGVKRIADHFDETFVVVMGDALTDIDVREVVAFYNKRKALATLALMPVSDTSQYGVVRLNEEGNILAFQEKPDPKEAISTLANTGIYVLEPRALEYIPEDTFFDFANDLFPRALEVGKRFVGYRGEDFYWSDVGTLEAYQAAQADTLAGKVRVKILGERLAENLWIDKDASFHQTVAFEGAVVLSQDAVIGREVTLSGNVTVGPGCRVFSGVTVKSSILLPGSRVGTGLISKVASLGPATRCAQRHASGARPSSTAPFNTFGAKESAVMAAGGCDTRFAKQAILGDFLQRRQGGPRLSLRAADVTPGAGQAACRRWSSRKASWRLRSIVVSQRDSF